MRVTTFRTMIGQADYRITEALKNGDVFAELERISIPTLVLGGEFDKGPAVRP